MGSVCRCVDRDGRAGIGLYHDAAALLCEGLPAHYAAVVIHLCGPPCEYRGAIIVVFCHGGYVGVEFADISVCCAEIQLPFIFSYHSGGNVLPVIPFVAVLHVAAGFGI